MQASRLEYSVLDLTKSVETALVDQSVESKSHLRPSLVVNDYTAGEKVLTHILRELRTCDFFQFSVAFIAESGLILLADVFDELAERGVHGQIITGTYLTFNNPKAFRWLLRYPNIDVRVHNDKFHPKGYLFSHGDAVHMVVGSANITDSALTANNEWSIAITSKESGKLVHDARREFNRIWNHEKTSMLTAEWIERYEVYFNEQKRQRILPFYDVPGERLIQPNAMQLSALEGLAAVRAEGKDRALLISATGTGKTYLSAFDVRECAPRRVLFVVHRRRIVDDALRSFRNVLGDAYTYGVFSGAQKEMAASCVFATVQTLSIKENMACFDRDAFDYLIVDEVHRAGAESYQRVLEYFRPKFLLGMSATPERNDSFDIYKLFNHTVAYEIRLNEALENEMLAPFHYFGVHEIRVDGELLDDNVDFNHLVCDQRVDHVIESAQKYGYSGDRLRGLVFCSSVNEAKALSARFNERGYRSVALSGDDSEQHRGRCIDRLSQAEDNAEALDYIFTVDIFNEGVDIPAVNQVIMLRPTMSPIVFVQQLGRGLRMCENKDYLVVIDFIGNYQNNYMIPIALFGDRSGSKERLRKHVAGGYSELPGTSTVSFDRIARERILENINHTNLSKISLIRDAYQTLKQQVGGIPTLGDFVRLGSIDPVLIFQSPKLESYHAFLSKYDPDYSVRFSKEQETILRFVSVEFGEGKRVAELVALKALVEKERLSIAELRDTIAAHSPSMSASAVLMQAKSACNILSLAFYGEIAKRKYLPLVSVSEDAVQRSKYFSEALEDDAFVVELSDLIEFGLEKNRREYSDGFGDSPLALYQRYSRKDACRLLCWKHDDSSTVYGYTLKTNDWLIFVTYKKSDDINSATKYLDGFESPSVFNWMTRHNVSLESGEGIQLQNYDPARTRIHLFVKKEDGEGRDHYYLGTVQPEGPIEETTIKNDDGKELPILRLSFKLDKEVRRAEYEYLIGA